MMGKVSSMSMHELLNRIFFIIYVFFFILIKLEIYFSIYVIPKELSKYVPDIWSGNHNTT